MSNKQIIVVLTGAGISAESGISTFRDSNGLWENHRIEDVASPEGWKRNKSLVLDFYNLRRKQLLSCSPNAAHIALAKLEEKFEVIIVTQNVDDLHERGGSTHVLHLHGELRKAQSTVDPLLVYDWDKDITLNDKCERGAQLRPFIVWFGEAVPKIEEAITLVQTADILLVIGTSLVVYPAAGLTNFTKPYTKKWLIDPNDISLPPRSGFVHIKEKATIGVTQLVNKLLNHD